ncbi:hypothetical protein BGZ80_006816 [Entomortierella chlamydospora]|uniref:Uncharacterized protein n=1 Tax=Entomortierella chlamydospora TaxID=101097 RepID=A0A9P6N002_9FUNG|nr:hypothetical protein BGZ79_007271 [Entomortierella chlamydospora]KAG0018730.1 hypothetical protein BGZ80_006816 [Entomortierella chlamydospora]
MHGLVFLFGSWLLVYRNRGFNIKIITELFTIVGTGVRPKPMDCLIFFTSLASLVKIGVNLPLILDVLKDMLWLRIVIEQTYWIVVSVGFAAYFVGLLYAMPVTTRQGIFAVYQPETAAGSRPLAPIHLLTPTTVQKNFLLVMSAVYPAIFASGAGIASAALAQIPGRGHISHILLIVEYANWVVILFTMSIMFFYYGLKYTFILRANIIIAEAALKAPKVAFGISNLRSSSPARFLFVQLQITGFGGALVTLIAGLLCMIWCICRDSILKMQDDKLPHTIAFFWTCGMALMYFVVLGLIAAQSIRNRRRGLHDASQPDSSGDASQKRSSFAKSLYSSQLNNNVRTDSETRLAQRSSEEQSTLHSIDSVEKGLYDSNGYGPPGAIEAMVDASRRMDHDAFSVTHNANRADKDRLSKNSLGTPSRPFVIKGHLSSQSPESGASNVRRGSDASVQSTSKVQPDLRQTVFGGGGSSGRSSKTGTPLPPTPTSPSFPLMAMRSRLSKESNRGQVSNIPIQSGSHTVSNGATYVSIPEECDESSYEPRVKGGRNEIGGEYGHSMPPHQNRQPMLGQEDRIFQSVPYGVTQGVLSPPPRTFHPLAEDTSMTRSPPQATLINFNGGLEEPQYSHVPRTGGGVRRQASDDPSWPLAPL